jgi:hypothetical protein
MNKLTLDGELYSSTLTARAIENYRQLAKISIKEVNEAKTCFVLVFEECHFPVGQTILEFENHLIELNIKIPSWS